MTNTVWSRLIKQTAAEPHAHTFERCGNWSQARTLVVNALEPFQQLSLLQCSDWAMQAAPEVRCNVSWFHWIYSIFKPTGYRAVFCFSTTEVVNECCHLKWVANSSLFINGLHRHIMTSLAATDLNLWNILIPTPGCLFSAYLVVSSVKWLVIKKSELQIHSFSGQESYWIHKRLWEETVTSGA